MYRVCQQLNPGLKGLRKNVDAGWLQTQFVTDTTFLLKTYILADNL